MPEANMAVAAAPTLPSPTKLLEGSLAELVNAVNGLEMLKNQLMEGHSSSNKEKPDSLELSCPLHALTTTSGMLEGEANRIKHLVETIREAFLVGK